MADEVKRPARFRLVDGSTFLADEAAWIFQQLDQEAIEATGHFAHEEGDSWNPPPAPISLFIPARSVVWWQEPDQVEKESNA
jgi:hypothetical protein